MELKNWAVITNDNGYTAPEAIVKQLSGYVYGHSKFLDGQHVVTSKIIDVNGRVVKTTSGSFYVLEEPHPSYLKFLDKNNIKYSPDIPISL